MTLDGTVHPAYRRRGIGSQLVPTMLARAAEYVREHGEDLRPIVTGKALSDNTDLDSILQKEGLRPERWQFVMLADLKQGRRYDAPELPDGYTLHPGTGSTTTRSRSAQPGVRRHYGFVPWSAARCGTVGGGQPGPPALAQPAARGPDGTIAAYLQSNEYDAAAEATGIREAYVAKVGTIEEHRRRGLAGVLLQIALDRYRDEGFDRAALDVDSENPTGALGIYERAGFRTDMRWATYRLVDSPDSRPGRARCRRRRRRRAGGSAHARTAWPRPSPTGPSAVRRPRRRGRCRAPAAGRTAPRPRPGP